MEHNSLPSILFLSLSALTLPFYVDSPRSHPLPSLRTHKHFNRPLSRLRYAFILVLLCSFVTLSSVLHLSLHLSFAFLSISSNSSFLFSVMCCSCAGQLGPAVQFSSATDPVINIKPPEWPSTGACGHFECVCVCM